MSRSGIRRKVDDLGRVVIPVGLRRTLGITEGDELEFAIEGDRIVLERPQDRCVLCGEDRTMVTVHDRLVCTTCVQDLADKLDTDDDQVVVLPEIEPASGAFPSNTAW